MRRIKRLGSIAFCLYTAAITLPDDRVDEHLPAPAATVVNGTLDLVETTAHQGFDAVRAEFRDRRAVATDGAD